MIKRIVFEEFEGKVCAMESLPKEEQDKIFELAHDNNVFIRDANGELWQVLDLQEVGK